jgi:hypothetical protein
MLTDATGRRLVLFVPLILLGCSGTGGDDPPFDLDPDAIVLRGPCDREQRLGGFEAVDLDDGPAVDGVVREAPIPFTIEDEVDRMDECRVMRRRDLSCSPPCAPGTTCDADGTCVEYPRERNVGVVTVRGLAADVSMSPRPPGFKYYAVGLPDPPFVEGAPVMLSSTDGWAGELALYGIGVRSLEVLDAAWQVRRGYPLAIHWTPAGGDARATISLRLNFDQHGLTALTLHCDLEDTGHYEIPVSLVDTLLDAGLSGLPSGRLGRRTVDSMDVDVGCIEFVVGSFCDVPVEVEGYTPP